MFDCGPLEKLRCKFTQQEHYMSAILKQRIEPPTTSRNTQHENELNELRWANIVLLISYFSVISLYN